MAGLGGFVSQTLHIKNDSDTCNKRKMLLVQVDSKNQKLYNLDWLHRMGLAYPVKDGETWELKSCINPDGKITSWVVWDKGIKEFVQINGKYYAVPSEVITSPSQSERIEEQTFKDEQGIHFKMRGDNGDVVFDTVYYNLDGMSPIEQTGNRLQVSGINTPQWKSERRVSLVEKESGISHYEVYLPFDNFIIKKAIERLMNSLGISSDVQSWIKFEMSDKDNKDTRIVKEIKTFMKLLSGFVTPPAYAVWAQIRPVPLTEFKNAYKQAFLEKLMETLLYWGDASHREAWLITLGKSLNKVDVTNFHSNDLQTALTLLVNMSPILFSAFAHPLDGKVRGNIAFFKLDRSQFPQDCNVYLPAGDDKDRVLCITDEVGGVYHDVPIIAVPIFKEGSTIGHKNNPSDFIYQNLDSTSAVNIHSKEHELFSNVKMWAVFYVDENGKLQPFINDNSNVWTKSEYIPTSINELGHVLGIMTHYFELTTDYADREINKPHRPARFLSPAIIFRNLEALLYTRPFEAILICEELGILELLHEIRSTYYTNAISNREQMGYFVKAFDEDSVTNDKHTAGDKFYKLGGKGLVYSPADVDLFIKLLSLAGAQRERTGNNKKVYLPLKYEESTSSYICGSAKFGCNEKIKHPDKLGQNIYLHPLDYLGEPVRIEKRETKNNKGEKITVNKAVPTSKPFSELKNVNEKKSVEGILLRCDLSPYHVRRIFGGIIKGVLPTDPNEPKEVHYTKFFTKVSQMHVEKRGDTIDTLKGYYNIHDFVLEYLGMNNNLKHGKNKDERKRTRNNIHRAVNMLITDWSAEIVEKRAELTNERYIPMVDPLTILFLKVALAINERRALNWLGNMYKKS